MECCQAKRFLVMAQNIANSLLRIAWSINLVKLLSLGQNARRQYKFVP